MRVVYTQFDSRQGTTTTTGEVDDDDDDDFLEHGVSPLYVVCLQGVCEADVCVHIFFGGADR